MPNRLALFDCDGTLVDSTASVCTAMEHALAGRGRTVPERQAIRRVIGLNLIEAMHQLLPGDEDHAGFAEDYKRAFWALRQAGQVNEPLFEGMAEALAVLEQDGWLLGVATGKSDRGLQICLTRHGIADRFVTLQTADRHPSKPHPAMVRAAIAQAGAVPRTTVMIGDTCYDIGAAKAACAHAIGAGWGCHAVDELVACGADAIAARPGELPAMLAALVGAPA